MNKREGSGKDVSKGGVGRTRGPLTGDEGRTLTLDPSQLPLVTVP